METREVLVWDRASSLPRVVSASVSPAAGQLVEVAWGAERRLWGRGELAERARLARASRHQEILERARAGR